MKKLLCLILALALCAAPLSASAESLSLRPSTDAAASAAPDWASEGYAHLDRYAIASEPSGPIDRGHFLQLLVQALQVVLPAEQLSAVDLSPYYTYFRDNYQDYQMSMAMTQAAAYGLTEGSLQGELRLGNFTSTLTRQEAAKMLCSALDFCAEQGYDPAPAGTGAPAVYADAASIAAWAAPYTGRIAGFQLMQGDQFGNFNPTGELDWPSAVMLASRTLTLMENAAFGGRSGVMLQSQMDWTPALNVPDYQAAKPLTGYALGYYAIANGDGTLSALTVAPAEKEYDASGEWIDVYPTQCYVESYDAEGKVTASKTIPMELPIWGGFLDGGDSFYLAFGQANEEQSDGKEVYRIVQYDRDWNRIAAASVTGGESYTTEPYSATVSRMTLSEDGRTLALHGARERYADENGIHHQSNITILVSTSGMKVKSVSETFPDNHVSHSFGQFVRYDGSKLVTVDHGDAYPRSFVLQTGGEKTDLLALYGPNGENKTYAIGSGLEVSDSGYLFLGCSAVQDGNAVSQTPWNVFLTVTDRNLNRTKLTWLTQGAEDIRCARLVKLSGDRLLAMWGLDGDVHYQLLDAKGAPVGGEGVLEDAPMPTTQPVVDRGVVRWIGVYEAQSYNGKAQAAMFELEP